MYKSSVSCFNGAKFGINSDSDWQLVSNLSMIFSAILPFVVLISFTFSFWRCKNRHFPRLFYSTLYKVKKIFFIERLFLPHYLHIVTISVAKVEILMDFQCQLDINFIQIPCSFPPDAPLNTAKVHVFLNMSSQLPSKLCLLFTIC